MRKLVPLALLLALAGCKRPAAQVGAPNPQPRQQQQQQPGQNVQPGVHPGTRVVLNPGLGGGSGGAVQQVRKTVQRAVSQNDLKQLHLFIDSYSGANGRMPSLEAIAAALKQEAPSLYKLWEEQAIVVTGATQRESVWAYTVEPQSGNGDHLAVTNQGVESISRQALEQRLNAQR